MGRAYQERGMYYYSKGEYPKAIEDLSRAIEIAFGLGMYDRYNLNAFRGEALLKVRRYNEAVKEFTFAISKAPRPVYFYHRGLALKAMGRMDEANEDFKVAGDETGSIEWY
jgi:tetratricopeptide (TPR) repeat protein